MDALGQAEELLPQLPRRLVLRPRIMKIPQPPQHREELRGLPHLLAQLARPGIGAFHFRGRQTLGVHQHRAQGDLQASSCWVRSGVSGRVLSSSSPLVRCPIASTLAERWMARWPARCQ